MYGRSYDQTKHEDYFCAGLRYEFVNRIFINGGVNRLEVDSINFDPSLNSAGIAPAWIFY